MKKLQISFMIGIIFLIILLPNGNAAVTILSVTNHTTTITTTEDGLAVTEDFVVKNEYETSCTELQFWIQQEANDVTILAKETNTPLPHTITGNIYTCNLTTFNLTINPKNTTTLQIEYILPNTVEYFQKTLTYDTTSFVVLFNKKELYRGETIFAGTSARLLLYKPTEAPLNMTYIIAVLILVVLLIGSALLLLKKQRAKTTTSKTSESEELLTIKKTILMEALKEIEKLHRSKTISDETYTKLKEEYKQQAVYVMKKLDDIKTKT